MQHSPTVETAKTCSEEARREPCNGSNETTADRAIVHRHGKRSGLARNDAGTGSRDPLRDKGSGKAKQAHTHTAVFIFR